MKNIKLLAGFLFLTLLCSFAPVEWVPVESKAGAFKIMFPRQPTLGDQDIETEIGAIKMYTFMYEVDKFKDENAMYGVIYADYPDTMVHSDFKDEILDVFFDGAVKGSMKNVHGEMLQEKVVKYKDYPGRKVKIAFLEGKGIMYMQFYLVKNRMYIMQVACETAKDNNPAIDKFFNSFALL